MYHNLTQSLGLPGVSEAVLLVLGVAERALAAHGVGAGQGDVLLQQHGQDLVVVAVGRQYDGGHVHGGGVLRVLDPLHQFLQLGGSQLFHTVMSLNVDD